MQTTKVGKKKQPSHCGLHAFEKRCTSSFPPSKLFTQQGGTENGRDILVPTAHTMFKLYQLFEGIWPANTTQKGLAAHTPSHSCLSQNYFSCCYSRSTVRKRLCCCDNSTRELLWHSEHEERGEFRDSERPLHVSLISWHTMSIDKWCSVVVVSRVVCLRLLGTNPPLAPSLDAMSAPTAERKMRHLVFNYCDLQCEECCANVRMWMTCFGRSMT